MSFVFLDRNPPLDRGKLERFEEAIGSKLPDAYREFVLLADGAEVDPNHSVVRPTREDCPLKEIGITRILGIYAREEGVYSCEEALEEFEEFLPFNSVPFAEDTSGGFLVVDVGSGEVDFVNIHGDPEKWCRTGLLIAEVLKHSGAEE